MNEELPIQVDENGYAILEPFLKKNILSIKDELNSMRQTILSGLVRNEDKIKKLEYKIILKQIEIDHLKESVENLTNIIKHIKGE